MMHDEDLSPSGQDSSSSRRREHSAECNHE
jgi:hypothetical protein